MGRAGQRYALCTHLRYRSAASFLSNQLWTYYAGASETGGTWREGLLIETNIATALTDCRIAD